MNSVANASETQCLLAELAEACDRTLDLVGDLTPEQMMGPRLPIINPMLWDIGHGAWFLEFWVLRHYHQLPPILPGADALYNSAQVTHDTRWDLPLPSKDDTIRYKRAVLDRVTEVCGHADSGPPCAEEYDENYFLRLALFHDCMHAEALTYTRQTLAYSAPKLTSVENLSGSNRCEIPALVV